MKKIKAKKRTLLGKKSKILRKQGIIPAVIYNSKTESTPIEVAFSDIISVLKTLETSDIITIELDGKEKSVLLKEVETNPITNNIVHISFYEITEGSTIDVEIPIKLTGISPAVKNNIGVLIQPLTSILLRCKSNAIPNHLEVDLSSLEHVGQTLLLSDIKLPAGVQFIREEDKNKPVVTITSVQKQETVTTTEETIEEEGEAEETDTTTQEETDNQN